MTADPLDIFDGEAGRETYFKAYEELFAEWPVYATERMVATRFGETHVIEAGRPTAPALVLLPAVTVSATAWFANVAALVRHFRVHAVDTIGDAGRSRLTRAIERPAEYALWLGDVFDGLTLDRPAVAGHSYGGWLALQLAVHAPERVGRLALIAPSSGMAPFHLHIRAALWLANLPLLRPDARTTLAMQAAKGFVINETFVKLMQAVTDHIRPRVLFPGPIEDAELAAISTPTLLLVGSEEPLYDPDAALDRAKRLMANLTVERIDGAGHLLPMEKPETINERLIAFLSEPSAISISR